MPVPAATQPLDGAAPHIQCAPPPFMSRLIDQRPPLARGPCPVTGRRGPTGAWFTWPEGGGDGGAGVGYIRAADPQKPAGEP